MRATALTLGALCGWLTLTSPPSAEAATAYRCTLPDGRVIYTELRPPDAQCQPLSASGHVRSAPPAAPPADDDPASDETGQDDEVERRRQSCATARRNLELLESGRPVSRVDADGERVVLDAEQRAVALARTRESIAEWCDDAP